MQLTFCKAANVNIQRRRATREGGLTHMLNVKRWTARQTRPEHKSSSTRSTQKNTHTKSKPIKNETTKTQPKDVETWMPTRSIQWRRHTKRQPNTRKSNQDIAENFKNTAYFKNKTSELLKKIERRNRRFLITERHFFVARIKDSRNRMDRRREDKKRKRNT